MLDVLVAREVMGWKVEENGFFVGGYCFSEIPGEKKSICVFRPSVDMCDTFEMEKKLDELSMAGLYAEHLAITAGLLNHQLLQCNISELPPTRLLFPVIHATPKQRCEAALRTVEQIKEKELKAAEQIRKAERLKTDSLPKSIGETVKVERERFKKFLLAFKRNIEEKAAKETDTDKLVICAAGAGVIDSILASYIFEEKKED